MVSMTSREIEEPCVPSMDEIELLSICYASGTPSFPKPLLIILVGVRLAQRAFDYGMAYEWVAV